MKTCTKCGEVKAITEFSKKCDGLQPNCKACAKLARLVYYAANREKVKAASAAWAAANTERHKTNCAAWYAANRESVSAQKAEYYVENINEISVKRAIHYAANRERIRDRHATYYAANPENFLVYWHTRRARKLDAGGKLSKGLSDRLFALQRGKCACGCKQPLGTDYHLDHVMPLALGGTNTDGNMQLLRKLCNLQKHAKHPIDFMQQRGFLL